MSGPYTCSCCGGTRAETPAAKFNRPGLPAISYRAGTWGEFKATLLARLSSTDYPVLAGLTTRRDDDWTVALCDACAVLADVLTFYQERIANESYLRTATERRSVLELARLIGYQLAPGVAAGTALAFTLEAAPGQPAQAAQPVTIPVGTRVQSVPDPDQHPQNFETVEAIAARVEWNAIPARGAKPISIQAGLTTLYIEGTDNQLQQGDAILIVGHDRKANPASERWDVRWLERVEPDIAHNVTRIEWSKGLGSAFYNVSPAEEGVHVYVFRQRAALFGNNAPDPSLLTNVGAKTGSNGDWENKSIDAAAKRIDLDAPYPKLVVGSWLALTGGSGGTSPVGYVELYHVEGVAQRSQARYAVSGKYSTVTVDSSENLDPGKFGLRETSILAQSEELTLASRPLAYPLFGSQIELARVEAGLVPGQLLSVSGKRQRVAFGADVKGVDFGQSSTRTPRPGESFLMLAPPQKKGAAGTQVLAPEDLDPFSASGAAAGETLVWRLLDRDGTPLEVDAPAGAVVLEPALKDDPVVTEACTIVAGADGVRNGFGTTTLTLEQGLANCYERASAAVNANVARATHGESVSEIGGGGDAAKPNQTFALKQAPLTYVSVATSAEGCAATLKATVNNVTWSEVPTLYGAGRLDRVYALRQDDSGKTTVHFGDGTEGARLPSGQNNIRFAYRKGLGTAGNLRRGQLTTLLTRPPGVKAVTNPAPASGGQDPERLEDARGNAPLKVLTLGRAVSIDDYADYARAFAGISKACAIWIGDRRGRGIHLTVAGAGGDALPAGSGTIANLAGSLRKHGDPLVPLDVKSYRAATFTLKASLKIAGDHDPDAVSAAVQDALRSAYSFAARAFGQPVTLDEVYATIQNVDGVVAADIDQLYRCDAEPGPVQPAPRLLAALPAVQADGSVTAAELLTLDAAPINLGTMS